MRVLLLLFIFKLTFPGADDDEDYEITGQKALTVEQGKPITILLTDLKIKDAKKHKYPEGFSLRVYDGDDYSRDDDTVTPHANFVGELEVPVRVQKSGDASNKFIVKITVTAAAPINIAPTITGQQNLTTAKNQPLVVAFSNLLVTDPDDNYPQGFSMTITDGKDFSVNGNVITPEHDFTGTLTASVKVNDGEDNSNAFNLRIEVVDNSTPQNVAPIITGQRALTMEENSSLQIQLSDLTVTDPDDNYPNAFTLLLAPGNNYSINGNTVTPSTDFVGTLNVPVAVNDGEDTSSPFGLAINVIERTSDRVVQITGQLPLTTQVNVPVEIKLSHLIVSDSKQLYPKGFELSISPAPNYTVSENTVLPAIDFIGELSVLVSITDGKVRSNVYNLKISVTDSEETEGIPAAFTPNNDNANDTWSIKAIKDPEFYANAIVRIYTKSGLLVFESKGTNGEWDGKFNGQFLPSETYFYTIEADANRPELNKKGIVILLK